MLNLPAAGILIRSFCPINEPATTPKIPDAIVTKPNVKEILKCW